MTELIQQLSFRGDSIIEHALKGIDDEYTKILASILEMIYTNLKEER